MFLKTINQLKICPKKFPLSYTVLCYLSISHGAHESKADEEATWSVYRPPAYPGDGMSPNEIFVSADDVASTFCPGQP